MEGSGFCYNKTNFLTVSEDETLHVFMYPLTRTLGRVRWAQAECLMMDMQTETCHSPWTPRVRGLVGRQFKRTLQYDVVRGGLAF